MTLGIAWGGAILLLVAMSPIVPAEAGTPAYVSQWGTLGTGNNQFNMPTGIDVVYDPTFPRELVYVADTNNNRIQMFQTSGTLVFGLGVLGTGNGQLNAPADVTFSGLIYVADFANNRIAAWSSNGHDVPDFGTGGSGNGQFNGPGGVAADAGGYIYVSDTNNNRIQKFHVDALVYSYVTQWGSAGSGPGQFNKPGRIALGPGGNVYVVDQINNRIQVCSNTGAFVTQWGVLGSGNGQFNQPAGIAVDAGGTVYVADKGNNRIQKFTSAGIYLTQWGTLGTGNGQFDHPTDVAADLALNVYVADTNNNRIQKFGPDVTPPAVSLTSPVGGESWSAGSANDIHWTASDNVGVATIDLAYSSDNGTSWSPIVAGLANSGTYAWLVPNGATSQAKVRATVHDVNGLTGVSTSAAFTVTSLVAVESDAGSLGLRLARPTPNPMNREVRLGFSLPSPGPARIEICDLEGRLVWSWVSDQVTAGHHELQWDGRGNSGAVAGAGIYYVRLIALSGTRTTRLIRLR